MHQEKIIKIHLTEINPRCQLQIVWERGFIDSKMWTHYHSRGLDDNNEMVEELSLEHLMSGCTDFVNEVSQLEYVCKPLGVRALFTTKYHAEMAGEGVEYSWAHSKNLHRRTALSIKKGKSTFDSTTEYCISHDVLPTELIRK